MRYLLSGVVVQIVVYNLPDRDCSAKASDGELHLSDAGERGLMPGFQTGANNMA